jgi:DNA-directed RNA polymerase subunit RPC12/RpoP
MNSCSICLEKFTKSLSEIILGCSHKYHLNCIHTNITQGTTPNECPLCRSKIKMKDSLIKLSEEDTNKKQDIEKLTKEMTDCLRLNFLLHKLEVNILSGEIVQQTRQFFDSFVIEELEDIDYTEEFIMDIARDIYAERMADVLSDIN